MFTPKRKKRRTVPNTPMPAKRKRTYSASKSRKKQRVNTGTIQTGDYLVTKRIANNNSVLGSKLNVKLKYAEPSAVLSLVSGYFQYYNLNSLFDPDAAAGGHQPRGYDQISPLYERYMVRQATIRVTFFPQYDNTTRDGGMFYIYVTNNNSTPNETTMLEDANTVKAPFGGAVRDSSNALAYSTMPVTCQTSIDISKFTGLPVTDVGNVCTIGTNPTNRVYAYVMAKTADGSHAYGIIKTEITYHCTFADAKVPSAS